MTTLKQTLEELYSKDPNAFDKAVAEIKHNSSSTPANWTPIIILSAILSLLAILPAIFSWKAYPFNAWSVKYFTLLIPLFVFGGWYFTQAIIKKNPLKHHYTILKIIIPIIIYLIFYPITERSHTSVTTALALPILYWFLLAFQYLRGKMRDQSARREYLRHFFNTLFHVGFIELGGIILSLLATALFSSIFDYHFFEWYSKWIVPAGAISAVAVGGYLNSQSQSLHKLTASLARIFSPLFLITLVSYLGISLFSGKDPYQDRNFLITLNIILATVMFLMHLYLNNESKLSQLSHYLVFGLLSSAAIINAVALTAIFLRISSYGFTPNRIVILGTNIAMFAHLLRLIPPKNRLNRLTDYWLVYGIWGIFVAFILPFLFRFS